MWAVMLGPNNQAVPEGNWEEYRNKGWIYVWDVYCEKVKDPSFPRYRVWLTRGGRSKNNMLPVGETINYQGWNAFGSHGWESVDGFRTRRDAITYMLRQMGYTRKL